MHVASLVPEQWSRTFFWLVFSWSQFFFHNGDVDSYSSTCIRVKSNERNISLDLYIYIYVISCNIMKGQEMHIIFFHNSEYIYIYSYNIFDIIHIPRPPSTWNFKQCSHVWQHVCQDFLNAAGQQGDDSEILRNNLWTAWFGCFSNQTES